MRWLRALCFEEPCSQAAFVDYLARGRAARRTPRDTARARSSSTIPDCSHAPVIARLRCFRGIDTLSAAGLCAEVGNFAALPQADAALRVPRDRPLRAHL